MRVAGAHLTYCTNIHPGEDLASLRHALREHVVKVKRALSPDAAFGVGLRVANQASQELAQGSALAQLRAWLDEQQLYVFTINGFPYGAFHATRVKERVYEPDWRSDARLQYTNRLADQLAALLHADVAGSISTVPGAWKAALGGQGDTARMAEHMLQHVAHLHALREARGATIALALEPEPGCFLETVDETVAFFEHELFSERGCARITALTGVARGEALSVLQRHLGVCLDTCHSAVELEEPRALFTKLAGAGIGVKKLQLSAGLRVPQVDDAALAKLAAFSDDVYLHQTVERRAETLTRYADLPEAIAARNAAPAHAREWRIHFHVPIFHAGFGVLQSTRDFLLEVLALQRAQPISPHLEVETYTWDVLPAELRAREVTEDIARELQFVQRALRGEAVA